MLNLLLAMVLVCMWMGLSLWLNGVFCRQWMGQYTQAVVHLNYRLKIGERTLQNGIKFTKPGTHACVSVLLGLLYMIGYIMLWIPGPTPKATT